MAASGVSTDGSPCLSDWSHDLIFLDRRAATFARRHPPSALTPGRKACILAAAMEQKGSAQAGKIGSVPPRPRRRWRRTLVLLLLFLAAAFVADYFLYDRWSSTPDGSAFNQSANAVWLGPTWVFDEHPRADVESVAAELTAGEISLLFVDCGKVDSTGQLPARDDARVLALLAGLREAAPDLTILGWVHGEHGAGADKVNLEDAAVLATLVDEATSLVTVLGFDGVQYDLNPTPDGGPGMPWLAQETRKALGEEPLLSIAAGLVRLGWAPTQRVRSGEYYAGLARASDILVLRCQDAPVPWPRAYAALIASQTRELTGVVEQANPNCWLYGGVPGSWGADAAGDGRHVESLRNAIRGVTTGLRSPRARPAVFHGLALHSYETASEEAWQEWDRMWLGR